MDWWRTCVACSSLQCLQIYLYRPRSVLSPNPAITQCARSDQTNDVPRVHSGQAFRIAYSAVPHSQCEYICTNPNPRWTSCIVPGIKKNAHTTHDDNANIFLVPRLPAKTSAFFTVINDKVARQPTKRQSKLAGDQLSIFHPTKVDNNVPREVCVCVCRCLNCDGLFLPGREPSAGSV